MNIERMAEIAKSAAGRVVLAGAVAYAGSGFARPVEAAPANQTKEMQAGQCADVPKGSVVVGDAVSGDVKFYPFPQSGERGNITLMNADAYVCFPYGGKYRPEAALDAAYIAEQKRVLTQVKGCLDKCEDVNEWAYPNSMPNGGEKRYTETGIGADGMTPESIDDRIMAPGIGRQRVGEWCFFDGDGDVYVNGEKVYSVDNEASTGQQTRVHTLEAIEIDMQYGGNLECIGRNSTYTMEDYTRRADRNVNLTKRSKADGVDVIDIFPSENGRPKVTVTRR